MHKLQIDMNNGSRLRWLFVADIEGKELYDVPQCFFHLTGGSVHCAPAKEGQTVTGDTQKGPTARQILPCELLTACKATSDESMYIAYAGHTAFASK